MNSSVSRLPPTGEQLKDAPYMLRYFADIVERDQRAGVRVELAALVLVTEGDPTPAFLTTASPGQHPHHPLFIAGVFDSCRHQVLARAEESNDDQ